MKKKPIKQKTDKEAWLSTEEVADMLNVTQRRIQARIKQGHFRKKKCNCKRSWLIDKKSIDKEN